MPLTSRPPDAPIARLDDLLALDEPALDALYRAASCPAVPELTGAHRGRLLAWSGAPGPVARALRALAASDAFPWSGKTFAHRDGAFGDGFNRILGGRVSAFRFATRAGLSRAGDFDAVQLDYDRPGNPPLVRAIKDELRAVGPGLWLGQAWLAWRATSAPRLVLWFGLERSA